MEPLKKDEQYYRAKDRVAQIKGFYTSLISYGVFITFLGLLNYYIDGLRHPWFLWAALGWGIGLVFQAAKAFDWNGFIGKDWEERKLKEFMEKEDNEKR